MPNLLKYSNGWGHIIMSVALLAVAIVMILQRDNTLQGFGIGLVGTVAGYWFVTSSANAQQQNTVAVQVPAPAITVNATQQGGDTTNGTHP